MSNDLNVQGKKKIFFTAIPHLGVIFAPWKSCIKCFRKWKISYEEVLGVSCPIASYLKT